MLNKWIKLFAVSWILIVGACSSTTTTVTQGGDPIANATFMQEESNKIDFKQAALLNMELGQGYLEQGQVTRAKKKFLHALSLAPRLPEVHSGLGYFFETVGEFEIAERHYRRAISLGKERGLFHNNYALYLCSQNRFKEADKEFVIAAKDYNYPKTAEIYENAGLCALKAKDLTKAENYFKSAVRYDPKQVTALLELSELAYKHGNFNDAKIYLNNLRTQVEPTPRSLWLAIQVANKTQDQDAIASNGLVLKNLFPQSPEYKLYLALQQQ